MFENKIPVSVIISTKPVLIIEMIFSSSAMLFACLSQSYFSKILNCLKTFKGIGFR